MNTANLSKRAGNPTPLFGHLCRVVLIVTLLLLIPLPRVATKGDLSCPPIDTLSDVLPDDCTVSSSPDANGFWAISGANDQLLGRVGRTMPAASEAIGYRGPTEAIVLLDTNQTIRAVRLLASADTDDHVDRVRDAADFFSQFHGAPWNPESIDTAGIDGVSGATLTSLALAQGLLARMGRPLKSLVFADPMTLAEAKLFFPSAAQIRPYRVAVHSGKTDFRATAPAATGEGNDATEPRASSNATMIPGARRVDDAQNRQLGVVLRSGALVDDRSGYQGPSEILLATKDTELSAATRLVGTRLRGSFDNEPYVDYLRQDNYELWPIYDDKTLGDLAGGSPDPDLVEGVSGATMTSNAVAAVMSIYATRLIEVVGRARAEAELAAIRKREWRVTRWSGDALKSLRSVRRSWIDLLGIATLLAYAAGVRRKGLARGRSRQLWLIWVVVVFGLFAGYLVSLSLVAGWATEGIAWQVAPSLAVLLGIAILVPAVTKSNPYCSHLCPHGAVQQIIRMPRPPKSPPKQAWWRRRIELPRNLHHTLSMFPGGILVLAYVALQLRPTTDLSGWEPFHAYLFRIAPAASIAFAVATILASRYLAMGYCRYGCGTGRLLRYVRLSAESGKFKFADGVAIGLFVVAVAARAGLIGLP